MRILKKLKKKEKEVDKTKSSQKFGNSNLYSIGQKKYANVDYFKGTLYINFREFYEKDGKLAPGKGIALTLAQYQTLKDLLPAIDAEIASAKK